MVSQVWPLLAFLGFFLATALAYLARSGDQVPTEMAWGLFEPAALGLTASFALHESAHAIALKRIHSVTHIAMDRAAWRTSVIPEGTMTARQMAGVALVGPGSCVVVGALIWLSDLDRPLAWWYLAHAVFLLPVFGDGRALRHSLRMARKQPCGEDTSPRAPKAPAP
ncbi:hypothetical protein [Streptomyces sp. DSM 15324]|uniref:hypothetical protein n=1 Tax=Streptomyces sp. DSM 15324 TaxID=1739111 RepID=UPI0007468C5F|nr:hypothetical protein [Streptomyces sp. DSM 15324]KUO10462.1 hypothetical protein AQJ58_18820 [Streptomyces sp. DSM 15324]